MLTMDNKHLSSVYGPLESWRFGKSLGIDLIMDPSTCSFNCTYCQLGYIQNITSKRKIYVETNKILEDFKSSKWKDADVITFSGSGEPTLGLNLGEVIDEIKKITNTPITVLTNATLLNEIDVRNNLLKADTVSAKLDSIDDITLKQINRPAEDISFEGIIQGIKQLKADISKSKTKPKLQLQIMFMPQNKHRIKELAKLINEINPDEVALNTPTRPYPQGWDIFSRGAHGDEYKKINFETKELKKLSKDEASNIEEELKKLCNTKIFSVYKN